MTVFKMVGLMVKKMSKSLAVYLFISLGMALIIQSWSMADNTMEVNIKEVYLSLDNQDDSPLAKHLEQYISENAKIVELSETVSAKDAIIYSQIDYALTIKEGFGGQMEQTGKADGKLVGLQGVNTTRNQMVENLVNHYLSTWINFYQAYQVDDLGESAFYKRVDDHIGLGVKQDLIDVPAQTGQEQVFVATLSFMAYTLITLILHAVFYIMNTIEQPKVMERMRISPYGSGRISLELSLGNLFYVLLIWLVVVGLSLSINGWELIQQINMQRALISSLCFAFSVFGLAFLLATLIKNKDVTSLLVNLFSLGMAFISGVFVPRFVMNPTVLKVSSILPAKWYLDALDLTQVQGAGLDQFRQPWMVMVLMGLTYFVIAFVVRAHGDGKRKAI